MWLCCDHRLRHTDHAAQAWEALWRETLIQTFKLLACWTNQELPGNTLARLL